MIFIKKHLKTLIAIISIVAVIWLLFHMYGTINSLKVQNQALTSSRDSLFIQVRLYEDKQGELIAQVNSYELTAKEFKNIGDALGFENKKLKSQVGSLNNLVGYWKGQAQTHGGDTVTLVDTVYITAQGEQVLAHKFDWTNNHLSLRGQFRPVDKHFSFDYTYDVGGFELAAYRKKQGLFKPKQLVADVKFGDQSLRVSEFKGVVIKQGKKKFWETRGFAAGVGFVGGVFLMK